MSIRVVLLTTAEVDALQALVARAQSLGMHRAGSGFTRWSSEFQGTVIGIHHAAESARMKRANEALGQSVKWDRAGRMYFGLSPRAAREIANALERGRPFWDGGRGARVVRWFERRLRL